jgi:hypothetical protein
MVNASPPRCPALAQQCWNGGRCLLELDLPVLEPRPCCRGLLTLWLLSPAGPRQHGPWPVMEPGDTPCPIGRGGDPSSRMSGVGSCRRDIHPLLTITWRCSLPSELASTSPAAQPIAPPALTLRVSCCGAMSVFTAALRSWRSSGGETPRERRTSPL